MYTSEQQSLIFCVAGIFTPVSKISKAEDQNPSSVLSTPRTPHIDLASRLTAKMKKEKDKKEKGREKRRKKGFYEEKYRSHFNTIRFFCSSFVTIVLVNLVFKSRGKNQPMWLQRGPVWRLGIMFLLQDRNGALYVSMERLSLLQVSRSSCGLVSSGLLYWSYW